MDDINEAPINDEACNKAYVAHTQFTKINLWHQDGTEESHIPDTNIWHRSLTQWIGLSEAINLM